ncbi:hypothetical protein EC991_007420 [Linnemannia zychae]|nr:hypothetical protein EC991_007420 [Linnemannia zychae]
MIIKPLTSVLLVLIATSNVLALPLLSRRSDEVAGANNNNNDNNNGQGTVPAPAIVLPSPAPSAVTETVAPEPVPAAPANIPVDNKPATTKLAPDAQEAAPAKDTPTANNAQTISPVPVAAGNALKESMTQQAPAPATALNTESSSGTNKDPAPQSSAESTATTNNNATPPLPPAAPLTAEVDPPTVNNIQQPPVSPTVNNVQPLPEADAPGANNDKVKGTQPAAASTAQTDSKPQDVPHAMVISAPPPLQPAPELSAASEPKANSDITSTNPTTDEQKTKDNESSSAGPATVHPTTSSTEVKPESQSTPAQEPKAEAAPATAQESKKETVSTTQSASDSIAAPELKATSEPKVASTLPSSGDTIDAKKLDTTAPVSQEDPTKLQPVPAADAQSAAQSAPTVLEEKPKPESTPPVAEERPKPEPVASAPEEKPKPEPVAPVAEEKPKPEPVAPVAEEKPKTDPAAPVAEEKPKQEPVAPVVEEKPKTDPAAPVAEEKPKTEPAAPVVEEKPKTEPATPAVEEKPKEEPTAPVVEEKPKEEPAAPVTQAPPEAEASSVPTTATECLTLLLKTQQSLTETCQKLIRADANLIQGAELGPVSLDFMYSDDNPVISTDGLRLKFSQIPGHTLSVLEARHDVTIAYKGADVATFSSPWTPATMQGSTLNSPIDHADIKVLSDNTFSDFVATLITKPEANIVLKGVADVNISIASTTGGPTKTFVITGLQFSSPIRLGGFNNLSQNKFVQSNGYKVYGQNFYLTSVISFTNPSDLDIIFGSVSFDTTDSTGKRLSSSAIDVFEIASGENDVELRLISNVDDSMTFLNKLHSSGDTVNFQGTPESSTNKFLAAALSQLKFAVTYSAIADIPTQTAPVAPVSGKV